MSDKVSYIIPCYNSQKWIWQAVASCYRQDLPFEWEIVLVDDGSSDFTTLACKLLWEQDPGHIKFFAHPTNLGQNPTKIDAIDNSTGNWIFALDHDNALS